MRSWSWCFMLLAAMSAGASPQVEPPPQFITAVWKVQSLEFSYRGYNTTYSCDTLERRLRAILHSVGARETLTIVMQRCIDQGDSARMQLTFASPVEATAENIAAVTSHDSRDVLIAKVRNEPLPTLDTIERFPAAWKTISMSRDKALRLDSSDCELVQQLRRDVFPRLSIRVVHDNLKCSVTFPNLGQPQLSVAALVAVPVQH